MIKLVSLQLSVYLSGAHHSGVAAKQLHVAAGFSKKLALLFAFCVCEGVCVAGFGH